jgi:hypothetical protein
MSAELTIQITGLLITLVTVVGTAFNVWVSLRVRSDISEMKVWCLEKFVEKAECRSMIQTYLSQERGFANNRALRELNT